MAIGELIKELKNNYYEKEFYRQQTKFNGDFINLLKEEANKHVIIN